MLIAARYSDPEHTQIVATDDQGREWQHPVDCQAGLWLNYLASNGQIDNYEAPPVTFQSLTPRQIRLGLLGAGITEAMVDSALANDASGLIEWKYATTYNRDHPLVSALSSSFSLTSEQIDTLWLSAAQL